jgi:hypothetical protein
LRISIDLHALTRMPADEATLDPSPEGEVDSAEPFFNFD